MLQILPMSLALSARPRPCEHAVPVAWLHHPFIELIISWCVAFSLFVSVRDAIPDSVVSRHAIVRLGTSNELSLRRSPTTSLAGLSQLQRSPGP